MPGVLKEDVEKKEKCNIIMKKSVLFMCLCFISSLSEVFGQADLVVGTDFQFNIQRKGDANAYLLHNAKYNAPTSTYQWMNTHGSFGSRGILFSYLTGISFFADRAATTANGNFTPTTRFFIGNDGYVGIGTTTPGEMLEVRGKIVIKADNSAFSIDDPLNARLGFVKKAGNGPVIASSNGNPIVFSQSNQPLITTNISTATFTDRMIIAGDGNVGIGTSTPRGKFDVDGTGDVYLSDDLQSGTSQSIFIPGQVFLSPYNGGNVSYFQAKRLDNSGTTSFRFRTFNNGTMTETLHMEGNGNVGIGTVTPEARLHVSSGNAIMDNNVIVKGVLAIGTSITSYTNNYSLAVNGKIGAKDIQIESKSWPDYVFSADYRLPSLSEVEQYIIKNKHLQDMPSADEVSKNGYSVSEVETTMLKKIEELTLYVIELQKQVDSLNAKLEKR
jgi:hypothetical protein